MHIYMGQVSAARQTTSDDSLQATVITAAAWSQCICSVEPTCKWIPHHDQLTVSLKDAHVELEESYASLQPRIIVI